MMKINITAVSDKLGENIPFRFVTNAQELDALQEDYSFDGDISVEGEYVNTGRCYRFTGTITCVKSFICDRCLEPSTQKQVHDFVEEFRQGSPAADEQAEEIVNYLLN